MGDAAAVFAQGQSYAAPSSAPSPLACNAPGGDGDEARWPGVPAAVLKPTLTSSGKPWEAAPGPRDWGTGWAQHVLATSQPFGSVVFTGAKGRAGLRGDSGYSQEENGRGVRIVIKCSMLDATSRLGKP